MNDSQNGDILKRICIRIEGQLASPLSAGSGEDKLTDSDVIMDHRGRAFVPGSSLAGAFRHYLNEASHHSDREAIDLLFGGQISSSTDSNTSRLGIQSPLMIYDMSLTQASGESAGIGIRDGVKLDSYKTAVDQGKYEVQVVETGTFFKIRFEWIVREDQDHQVKRSEQQQLILELIDGLYEGDLTVGAKSRRGLGKLKVEKVEFRSFDYSDSNQILDWMEWNWDQEMKLVIQKDGECWTPGSSSIEDVLERIEGRSSGYYRIEVPLSIRHTLMIRQYTDKGLGQEGTPDYEQMQMNGKAVIPGTSWTGAIRGRLNVLLEDIGIEQTLRNAKLESLFGTLHDQKQRNRPLKASLIRIEESIVQGGHALTMTRNKIDRFTGGTVSGGLYTMTPWVGGETELVFRWMKQPEQADNDSICGLLLWVIRDLQEGLLAVGGETAVGRGAFVSRTENRVCLNGEEIDDRRQKDYYQAAMNWCTRTVEGAAAQ